MIKAGKPPVPIARVMYKGVEQFEVKYNGTVVHVRKKHLFKRFNNTDIEVYGTWGFNLNNQAIGTIPYGFKFLGWSLTQSSFPPVIQTFPYPIKKTQIVMYAVYNISPDVLHQMSFFSSYVITEVINDSDVDISVAMDGVVNYGSSASPIDWVGGGGYFTIRPGKKREWRSTNPSGIIGAWTEYSIRTENKTPNLIIEGYRGERLEMGDLRSETTTT